MLASKSMLRLSFLVPPLFFVRRLGVVVLAILVAGCALEQGTQAEIRGILASVLTGLMPAQEPRMVYIPLGFLEKDRLPLVPHIRTVRARPTSAMMAGSVRIFLQFMVLDRRTLAIYRPIASVGARHPSPWGGAIYPIAFVPDLIIQDGLALHGPPGHVNPAVWVLLEDENARLMHEGWVFARDSAQTAWDHPRFDITFLGKASSLKKKASKAVW